MTRVWEDCGNAGHIEKRREQFGDAGGVHGNFDCRLPVGDLGEKCESGNPHPCKTRKDGAASVVMAT